MAQAIGLCVGTSTAFDTSDALPGGLRRSAQKAFVSARLVQTEAAAETESLRLGDDTLTLAQRDHRLVPAGKVDDGHPAMHERDVHDRAVGTDRSIPETPRAVGPSVLDGVVEGVEPGFWDGFTWRA